MCIITVTPAPPAGPRRRGQHVVPLDLYITIYLYIYIYIYNSDSTIPQQRPFSSGGWQPGPDPPRSTPRLQRGRRRAGSPLSVLGLPSLATWAAGWPGQPQGVAPQHQALEGSTGAKCIPLGALVLGAPHPPGVIGKRPPSVYGPGGNCTWGGGMGAVGCGGRHGGLGGGEGVRKSRGEGRQTAGGRGL